MTLRTASLCTDAPFSNFFWKEGTTVDRPRFASYRFDCIYTHENSRTQNSNILWLMECFVARNTNIYFPAKKCSSSIFSWLCVRVKRWARHTRSPGARQERAERATFIKATSARIGIFLKPHIFLHVSALRPHQTSESRHRSRIVLKPLSREV